MYRVVETLMDLARAAGVEFIFDAAVERIETDPARVRGVRLAGGARLDTDVVVANADLPYVYQALLPRDRAARALSRKRFSCSTISFFWGMDRAHEALGPHTLFLADDYRANFEGINSGLGLPADPSLYVHAPARLDPSMAPPGGDTLTAIIPVGHLSKHGEQDWSALRDQARGHVFRRLRSLGITDLEAHIKFERAYTPPAWRQRYNLLNGSTHGLAHTLTQLAYFRPANRHPRYQNLYFTGASTHPGTGVPTAMVSGRLVAERIVDDLHGSRPHGR
jgi:phytoene desaturase